jgi:hypothetical protein
MITIERHSGRLVEAHFSGRVTEEEIAASDLAMARCFFESSKKIAICADYRQLSVLSEELSKQLVEVYRRHNSNIEFSGILVAPTSGIAILQMERLVRESQNPNRKAFRSADALMEWLGQHLTIEERARMNAFLSRPPQEQ